MCREAITFRCYQFTTPASPPADVSVTKLSLLIFWASAPTGRPYSGQALARFLRTQGNRGVAGTGTALAILKITGV